LSIAPNIAYPLFLVLASSAHVTFDKPTCPQASHVLADASVHCGVKVHRNGTYICMEGPQFSTLAEAHMHRGLGFDVIGMTNVTEAKLAREAELCYSAIAMITDYDCWHPDHESVTGAQIIATLNQNAENAQRVLREAVKAMPVEHGCKCGSAWPTRSSPIPACAQSHEKTPGRYHRQIHDVTGKLKTVIPSGTPTAGRTAQST
jgi:hypothetical protein